MKAATAIQSAPGVLAVKVDYPSGQATIGTAPGQSVPREEILTALESIRYKGEFVTDEKKQKRPTSKNQTSFQRPAILERFDANGNGKLDESEKRELRGSFGNIDVPMLPASTFDYTTVRLPAHVKKSELQSADNTPPDNPLTNHGATLGRVLFYDKQLSRNNTVACSSCHLQRAGFSDPKKRSQGFAGGQTGRNAMSLANVRYSNLQGHRPGFFWDERAATVEAQVLMPIQDEVEMGMSLPNLETRLSQLAYYPALFKAAFGSPKVTSDRVAKAVAQFMRAMIVMDARFDRAAPATRDYSSPFPKFTEEENLGKSMFFDGVDGVAEHGCAHCHVAPTFSMTKAFNNGLAMNYVDQGLGKLGRDSNDPFTPSNDGKFKAPSLRNIELTAPYMHDGRFTKLEQVVDHYSQGVQLHENLGLAFPGQETAKSPSGMKFTEKQKAGLIAFLKTLTDAKFAKDPKFSDPFVRIRKPKK